MRMSVVRPTVVFAAGVSAAIASAVVFTRVVQAAQPTLAPLQMAPPADWQTFAQGASPTAPDRSTPAPVPAASDSGISGYFQNWFNRVEQAQASQPHWMTPLVTVTPRLEQELRYDQFWEHLGTGANINTFGSGKGLEFIPTTTNEVLLNPPAYT
jgi:hypothetical protein